MQWPSAEHSSMQANSSTVPCSRQVVQYTKSCWLPATGHQDKLAADEGTEFTEHSNSTMQHSPAGSHGRPQPAPRPAKEKAGSHGLQAPAHLMTAVVSSRRKMSRGTLGSSDAHASSATAMSISTSGWIYQPRPAKAVVEAAGNGNLAAAAAAQQAHGNPGRYDRRTYLVAMYATTRRRRSCPWTASNEGATSFVYLRDE
jgi:hypothetical protein